MAVRRGTDLFVLDEICQKMRYIAAPLAAVVLSLLLPSFLHTVIVSLEQSVLHTDLHWGRFPLIIKRKLCGLYTV